MEEYLHGYHDLQDEPHNLPCRFDPAPLFGFIQSFFSPAYRPIVPELVAKEHYSSANALTELGIQLGGLLGPVLEQARRPSPKDDQAWPLPLMD
jgi:hypothetical protein